MGRPVLSWGAKADLALRILQENGGWITVDQIHAKMGDEGCSPSHVLHTLEQRGLVTHKKQGRKNVWKAV